MEDKYRNPEIDGIAGDPVALKAIGNKSNFRYLISLFFNVIFLFIIVYLIQSKSGKNGSDCIEKQSIDSLKIQINIINREMIEMKKQIKQINKNALIDVNKNNQNR